MKTPNSSQRILSIDGFRAITMVLMLFVNDIPGLRNIPHWLHHAAATEDMLGFSDTIFPAFLFAVGLSIPFAIQKRMEKGESLLKVLWHIVERTIALVVMGLFTVNLDTLDGNACVIPHHWFAILMVVGFFLIWSVYPKVKDWKKYLFPGMRIAGVALLLGLYLIYKGYDGQPFGIQWWGILGLIGWTYLVAVLTYLITRTSLVRTLIAWGVFIALSVLTHAGVLNLGFIPGDMTLHALGVSGVLVAILMQHLGNKENPRRFILALCGAGALMLIGFFLSYPHWIISKIQATPTWLFICLAIYFPLFGLLYWLMDTRGITKWFGIIKPAGTVTLTCYIIPYLWYNVQGMLGWWYPEALGEGVPGLIKSLVFALIIVQIAGLLTKVKVRLKV